MSKLFTQTQFDKFNENLDIGIPELNPAEVARRQYLIDRINETEITDGVYIVQFSEIENIDFGMLLAQLAQIPGTDFSQPFCFLGRPEIVVQTNQE